MITKFDYLFRRVYLRATDAYNFLQDRYAKYLSLGTVWTDSSCRFGFRVRDHVLTFTCSGNEFFRITDFRCANSHNLHILELFAENFGVIRDRLHANVTGLSDRCFAILDSDKFDVK